MTPGDQARRYLASLHCGALATLSRKHDGHPFASLVPYVLDHRAHPVILASRLAEHTRNIAADARVSLLAFKGDADPQAQARATLLGRARALDANAPAAMRYRRFFPDSEKLLALGDFSFFEIVTIAVRYIAGFGSIHWIGAESYAPPANSLAEAEEAIVAHMNAAHARNLLDVCRRVHRRSPVSVTMIGIDCDGFDLRADGELLRIEFEQPVTDAGSARAALARLASESRTS